MNARMLKGLFMEHATRTWPFLAAGLLLVMFYLFPFWISSDRSYQYEVEAAMQTIALVIAGLGLLYSAADGERLTCELPQRTLLLPVSTPVIVVSKFLYDAAAIMLMSTYIHMLLHLSTGGPHEAWFYYPAIGVTIFSILQLLALATGSLGDWSFGILFGTFVVLVSYANLYAAMSGTMLVRNTALIFAACLLSSCMVVHWRRIGTWELASVLPQFARAGTRRDQATLPPFDSAFDAQLWFEAVRMRALLVGAFVCAAVAAAIVIVLERTYAERFYEQYTDVDRILWSIGELGQMLPYVFGWSVVFTGAVMTFQNFRLQYGPMRAFLCLRPMSSAELARARTLGTLRQIRSVFLIVMVLTVVLCSFWLLIDKANPSTTLVERVGPPNLAILLPTVFLGLGGAVWAVYWTGNIILGTLLYVAFSLLYWILILLGIATPNTWQFLPIAGILAGIFMCVILFTAVSQRLVALDRLIGAIVIAIVCAIALWVATKWDAITGGQDIVWKVHELPAYGLVALFLVLPLATTPLTLHWARHR